MRRECRRFQRKLLVSDPGMHYGTCVTHVPWCMSGSLTCGDGENVPGIPSACAPAILRIWQEAHGSTVLRDIKVISLWFNGSTPHHNYRIEINLYLQTTRNLLYVKILHKRLIFSIICISTAMKYWTWAFLLPSVAKYLPNMWLISFKLLLSALSRPWNVPCTRLIMDTGTLAFSQKYATLSTYRQQRITNDAYAIGHGQLCWQSPLYVHNMYLGHQETRL